MPRILITLLIFSAFSFAEPQATSVDTLEKEFVFGGKIRIELSAGNYEIRPSRDNKIRLHWSTEKATDMRRVHANIESRGSEASITTDGPDDNIRVEIEVPRRSDMHLRITAGNVSIYGIEGDKDIEGRAGNLDVDVIDPEMYKRVDGSVIAGNVEALPFHASKSGLFRSFHWNGGGIYRLHAHLMAGNITFLAKRHFTV
jgi:hypothetical protein